MGRRITIQYPDATIHNVEVYRFARTKDDKYFIEYYDNTEHADMYTVLVQTNETFVKDPEQTLTFNDFAEDCTELEFSKLPNHIKCRTLLMDRVQVQNQARILIYMDQYDNYYVSEELVNGFNIPNRGGSIIIDGIKYIKVNENDIHEIEERSKHILVPEYRRYYVQEQSKETDNKKGPQTLSIAQAQFLVYIDQSNNYYVAEDLANKYGIPNRGGSIIVDGIKYIKVYRTDVYDIVKKSKNTLIPVFKRYNLINPKENNDRYQYATKEERKIVTHQIMTYYYDINSATNYLDRQGYEIARIYGVEIEGKPKIIEGKNCYSITRNQLNELVDKTRDAYTWMCKSIVAEKKATTNIGYLSTYICKVGEDSFIPQDFYTKYKERTNQKRIKVDGTLYIKVSPSELAEIKAACVSNKTELILVEKNIIPKKTELNDMLNQISKEERENSNQK